MFGLSKQVIILEMILTLKILFLKLICNINCYIITNVLTSQFIYDILKKNSGGGTDGNYNSNKSR